MILSVIQGERLGVDDICRAIAIQRVGAFERLGLAIRIVVSTGSLKLIHGTRLCQNGEVHVLVIRQVRAAVLRPGEIDIAAVVDTQHLFTARGCRIRGTNELTVTIVGLYHHAGQRIVLAAVCHRWHIDRADLGFLTRDDNVLLEVIPGHSDGVTFNVLARPGVN